MILDPPYGSGTLLITQPVTVFALRTLKFCEFPKSLFLHRKCIKSPLLATLSLLKGPFNPSFRAIFLILCNLTSTPGVVIMILTGERFSQKTEQAEPLR